MSFLLLSLLVMTILSVTTSQDFVIGELQLPQNMLYHISGIYNDTLTVINGMHEESVGHTTSITNSYSVSLLSYPYQWNENIFTMPLNVTEILANGDLTIQIDNLLYIFNPYTHGNIQIRYNVVFVYDLLSNKYIQTMTPLFATEAPCTVYNSYNNIIYIIGGLKSTHSQTYNVVNNIWNKVSDINIVRGYHGCSMDANHENIFLFGGISDNLLLDSIEKYSVIHDEWMILKQTLDYPKANIKCNLLPMMNQILCSSTQFDTKWQMFDPTDYIIRTVVINIPRVSFSVTLWGNSCLFIDGGTGNHALNSIETFGECPIQKLYGCKNKRMCCIKTGDIGCTIDSDCCGTNSKCFKHVCVKVKSNVTNNALFKKQEEIDSRSAERDNNLDESTLINIKWTLGGICLCFVFTIMLYYIRLVHIDTKLNQKKADLQNINEFESKKTEMPLNLNVEGNMQDHIEFL